MCCLAASASLFNFSGDFSGPEDVGVDGLITEKDEQQHRNSHGQLFAVLQEESLELFAVDIHFHGALLGCDPVPGRNLNDSIRWS